MFSEIATQPIKKRVSPPKEIKTLREYVDSLDGCKSHAAKNLGIDRNTLYKYIDDTENELHEIRLRNGRYQFLAVKGYRR